MDNCIWIYRPGTNKSHFAIASCDKSFKYLSKISTKIPPVHGCADFYNGCICPSCGNRIVIDYMTISMYNDPTSVI